eukprot:2790578-Rhodomonas_salina.1
MSRQALPNEGCIWHLYLVAAEAKQLFLLVSIKKRALGEGCGPFQGRVDRRAARSGRQGPVLDPPNAVSSPGVTKLVVYGSAAHQVKFCGAYLGDS